MSDDETAILVELLDTTMRIFVYSLMLSRFVAALISEDPVGFHSGAGEADGSGLRGVR